jgi:DNA-binding transcriptional LysR family regulator
VAEELRPYAEALSATAASLLRAATAPGEAVRGTVRITASEVVGAEVLPPILTALRERHPRLVIELVLSNTMEDLLRRDADIAVRMAKPTQGALLAKHLGVIEVGLHAHRRYLAVHGTPARLEELELHALIGFDKETAPIRSMLKRVGGFSRASFTLRANSDLAQLAAIRAGYGIGFCQVRLSERDGDLARVLPHALTLTLDTWLAMHADLRRSRRCRVVFDAIADGLVRYIKG